MVARHAHHLEKVRCVLVGGFLHLVVGGLNPSTIATIYHTHFKRFVPKNMGAVQKELQLGLITASAAM